MKVIEGKDFTGFECGQGLYQVQDNEGNVLRNPFDNSFEWTEEHINTKFGCGECAVCTGKGFGEVLEEQIKEQLENFEEGIRRTESIIRVLKEQEQTEEIKKNVEFLEVQLNKGIEQLKEIKEEQSKIKSISNIFNELENIFR